MRIATLQFSPRIGHVDDNIARADLILSSSSSRVQDIDLLVLPELAFTGYNHPSLQSISPYLEPTAAGPSTKWAIRTARRLGCFVTVGYPELFSPTCPPRSSLRPTMLNLGPEPEAYYTLTAYNSTVTVNAVGEVVAHYRKTHLYYTDEVWAQESPVGFTTIELEFPPRAAEHSAHGGQGITQREEVVTHRTTQAICMDLNNHHFTSQPLPSALCKQVLSTETTLLVLSTAWLTHLPSAELVSQPEETDWDTLAYWFNALLPLMEGDREVICVFANRCGEEGGRVVPDMLARQEDQDGNGPGVRYAGSSWIGKVGVGSGKVVVGGMLGRAEEGVLVVETDGLGFGGKGMKFELRKREGEQ
ncbi:MAG: hypothetical protein Q9168_003674 [Polycauliona sp. 1 TL-2023]